MFVNRQHMLKISDVRFIPIQRHTSIRWKDPWFIEDNFSSIRKRWYVRDELSSSKSAARAVLFSLSPAFFLLLIWQVLNWAHMDSSFFSTSRWYNPEVTITCITWLCTSVVEIRRYWSLLRRRPAVFATSPISRLLSVTQSRLSGALVLRYATWHI